MWSPNWWGVVWDTHAHTHAHMRAASLVRGVEIDQLVLHHGSKQPELCILKSALSQWSQKRVSDRKSDWLSSASGRTSGASKQASWRANDPVDKRLAQCWLKAFVNGKGNPPEIGLTSNHFPTIRGRASERASERASGWSNEQAKGQKAQPQFCITLCWRGVGVTCWNWDIIPHFPAISGAS